MLHIRSASLFCSVLISMLILCMSEDLLEDDIPVVEGDGGIIKTAVEGDVLILTKENFDIQVSSKDIMLVEFYAPWCGHCKALEPEYAKAAKILKEEASSIYLAKVDATTEAELASRFDVSGYPTMFIFKKGVKVPYDGPRTALGIVEYMKERSDPNWKPPPEAVITLNKENFEDIVSNAAIILVEFYAPWCGHCKQLAPEYERAAKVLKSSVPPVPLAKIDGIEEKELAEKYEARGWPTLMIFRKGRKYDYEGPRDESGIVNYMKEQAKPPSQEVKSVKDLKKSIGKIDTTIVGYFDSETESFYENYVEAANSLRSKFTFLHSFSKDVLKYSGSEKQKIILYKPELFSSEFEKKQFELDDINSSPGDISKFIKDHALPLVGERSHKSMWKYQNKYPIVVVYYDVDFGFDYRKQTQLIRKEVVKVAKDYKAKITFAISNENEFEDELNQLGLADSGEDVNVGYYESAKIRYRMEPVEDFSADELREFVRDVLAGNVKKHIKSQPVPKENKGPVTTIVGSSFDSLITQSKKDVLVEFYAPWCGHCKKLDPEYKKLGKAFSNHDKLLVAKIDATANDFPSEYKVDGFPTIYYVPAHDKKNLIVYEGERNLEAMTKFVNDQLSKSTEKDEL
ncbi:protein disulfide-isomerase A4 [Parasteatoda tepidariorum]|uniref:protein disulfide-isomerase A4 n=1 Tax=Parasteatoda tepidariorum TaxID=114398 RepID=UPI001C722EED|nr:protein disulfide-isomerase A4 [Parasteatoda tepidariorum]